MLCACEHQVGTVCGKSYFAPANWCRIARRIPALLHQKQVNPSPGSLDAASFPPRKLRNLDGHSYCTRPKRESPVILLVSPRTILITSDHAFDRICSDQ